MDSTFATTKKKKINNQYLKKRNKEICCRLKKF